MLSPIMLAAVIGTPIAVSIAQTLGMPVEPFVLGVLFGANMSYATLWLIKQICW